MIKTKWSKQITAALKTACLFLLLLVSWQSVNAAVILDPNGISHLAWIFDTQDWTASSYSSLHVGDDYYADDWTKNDGNTEGQNAYAMAAGTVIYAGDSPGGWSYGKQVVVRCSANPSFAYRYAHLNSIAVNDNQIVSQGALLGTVGKTGGNFGPHLHSVLYKNISSSDGSLAYLEMGMSPSGSINGYSDPTKYAAPFYNDSGDFPPGGGSDVHLDVFVRGMDNQVYHRWQANELWSSWESLGAPPGGAISSPSAVCWGNGRVDLFVRGADSALWHKWFNGSYWGGWESLGGYITSAPDAASWGPGHIDVFVRGGDNALYYKRYQNGYWSGWQWLGGTLTSGPAAVSPKGNQVYVFVRGADAALYYREYINGYWYGWQWLGGYFTGDPDAASWGEGHLDVFVRDSSNYLYHRWIVSGYGWSEWESLDAPPGLVLNGPPGVVSPLYNRVDAFVRGNDNQLWHRYFNGSNWGSWENLGGQLQNGPDAASWSLQK